MKKLFVLLLLWSGLAHSQGSYALYDYDNAHYQVVNNADQIRPIASITKLFTAIVVLRSGAELDERVKVQGKAKGRFAKGMMVSRIDLMRAMLISSDNLAAETLANTYPGGFNQYIQDANQYVKGMGMIHTELVDASGLLPGNVSTVPELIHFLWLIRQDPNIRAIANERSATLSIPKGKKTLKINLHNTNPTLFKFDNILISKTGFTNPAGRCVVMLVEKEQRLYAVVILGQKDVQARSTIAKELIAIPPAPIVVPAPIEFDFPL